MTASRTFRRNQRLPELPSDAGRFVRCGKHGRQRNVWVICTHVDHGTEPASARRLDDEPEAAGHVLCVECLERVERARTTRSEITISDGSAEGSSHATIDTLRIACEGCVLDRWPLEDAS